jgi:hypothetical protein
MIKNDVLYRWGSQEIQDFNSIRKSIIKAHSLMSLDFSQDFTLYTFSYDKSYAVVLTPKNAQNNEIPISFMRSSFKGAELNYPTVDYHVYVGFKDVKHFRS